ncbi:MAG: sporulation transcriptional regulator SpoIIID [Bacillota bacterium]|nr:sporulation transcriptional regulator SpoIIID [Bacillota bacterium]
MRDYIEERVMAIAGHILQEEATVRAAARVYRVSKSTVHKDMAERLPKINPQAAKEVMRVLQKNKSERHLRGGRATFLKYKGGYKRTCGRRHQRV